MVWRFGFYRELDEVGERVDGDRLAHALEQVVQLRRIQCAAAVRVRLDKLGLQCLVRDVSATCAAKQKAIAVRHQLKALSKPWLSLDVRDGSDESKSL